MIFESKIFLKSNQTPTIVSYAVAQKVDRAFQDHMVEEDQIISVGNLSFRKNQIRSVIMVKDSVDMREKNTGESQKFYEEERLERVRILKNPRRHEDTEFFSFLIQNVCGITVTDLMLMEARTMQESFFRQNPRRVYCDPILYEKIVLGLKGAKLDHAQSAAMRMVSNMLSRDFYLAK